MGTTVVSITVWGRGVHVHWLGIVHFEYTASHRHEMQNAEGLLYFLLALGAQCIYESVLVKLGCSRCPTN